MRRRAPKRSADAARRCAAQQQKARGRNATHPLPVQKMGKGFGLTTLKSRELPFLSVSFRRALCTVPRISAALPAPSSASPLSAHPCVCREDIRLACVVRPGARGADPALPCTCKTRQALLWPHTRTHTHTRTHGAGGGSTRGQMPRHTVRRNAAAPRRPLWTGPGGGDVPSSKGMIWDQEVAAFVDVTLHAAICGRGQTKHRASRRWGCGHRPRGVPRNTGRRRREARHARRGQRARHARATGRELLGEWRRARDALPERCRRRRGAPPLPAVRALRSARPAQRIHHRQQVLVGRHAALSSGLFPC